MNVRELQGKEKADEVNELMSVLEKDFKVKKLTESRRVEILQTLRVHGRRTQDADAIYSKQGLVTLSDYAFEQPEVEVAREAMRCISNALILMAPLRQMFVDLGNAPKTAVKLREQSSDDEFLASRLLFLTTYNTNLDYNELFSKHALGQSINNHIRRHSEQISKANTKFSPADELAFSETLKLLFNVTNFFPRLSEDLAPCVPCILKTLTDIALPTPPLSSPINYLINALLNLDLEAKREVLNGGDNPFFPTLNTTAHVDRLIAVLDLAISTSRPAELDIPLTTLLTLLRKVYSIAPEGVRRHLERTLLPENDQCARDAPIGSSNSLPSRLLRLSTSPVAPSLAENISSLMFELSGSDAARFVQNIGYGFAAGFLMSHNVPIPENAKSTSASGSASDLEADSGAGNGADAINPITGQRFAAEPVNTGPPMTEEEKEREAERLFVLFERLQATGVVRTENPVASAVREGRFEELPDDADSE